MTDFNIDQIIEDGIKAARETIATCDLIITRMVDYYVLALDDGSVMHGKTGVRPFGVSIGDVEKTRDRKAIEDYRKHLIEMNPDNSVVARLRIMSWKTAARAQKEVALKLIEGFEELRQAP